MSGANNQAEIGCCDTEGTSGLYRKRTRQRQVLTDTDKNRDKQRTQSCEPNPKHLQVVTVSSELLALAVCSFKDHEIGTVFFKSFLNTGLVSPFMTTTGTWSSSRCIVHNSSRHLTVITSSYVFVIVLIVVHCEEVEKAPQLWNLNYTTHSFFECFH